MSVTKEQFYGHSEDITKISGTSSDVPRNRRHLHISSVPSNNFEYRVPDKDTLPLGGPIFIFTRDADAPSNTARIAEPDSTLIDTIDADEVVELCLSDGDVSGGRKWYTRKRARASRTFFQ